MGMTVWRIVGIGVMAFLLPLVGHTVKQWWGWRQGVNLAMEPSCEYNLKSLWFLSRRVSHQYHLPFPPPFKVVKDKYVYRGEPVLMTRQLVEYLGLEGLAEGAYWTFKTILICAKDPKYLMKMAKMQQSMDYEPSYRWCPDERTLAECPYCQIVILLDGRVERRKR